MNNQIEFAKPPGKWVMKITADRRIEINEGVTVTEAAQTVLEAVQQLLNQPERKPLTDQEIEATFLTCNGKWDGDQWVIEDADFHPFVRAITALRAALEQPKGLFIDMIAAHGPEFVEEMRRVGENIEQQAEPVAYCYVKKGSSADALTFDQKPADAVSGTVFPLYTTPPQRKLLTGEQIEFAWMKAMQSTPGTTLPIHEFARAIEQAHGIKETP